MGTAMTNRLRLTTFIITALYAALILVTPLHAQNPTTLLNVSYDIARDLFGEINAAFTKSTGAKAGPDMTVSQSHNGSLR
jgi:sulfate transport system substrate-binding protein